MKTQQMLIAIIFLTLIFGLTGFAHADYGWVDIRSNIPGDPNTIGFTDVHAIGDKVWITTSNTTNIYYSGNGGTSFSTQSTGTRVAETIFMKSETEGYAGTSDGRVLRTTNGSTWSVIGGTLLNPINSISFPVTGDGYCCGNNGWIGTVNSSRNNWYSANSWRKHNFIFY